MAPSNRRRLMFVLAIISWLAVSSRAEILDIADEESLKAEASKGPVFVQFLAPWCGHCKTLAPIWAELDAYATKHVKNLKLARVDCTSATGGIVCKNYKVNGYPTLRLIFPKQEKQMQSAEDKKTDKDSSAGGEGSCPGGVCVPAERERAGERIARGLVTRTKSLFRSKQKEEAQAQAEGDRVEGSQSPGSEPVSKTSTRATPKKPVQLDEIQYRRKRNLDALSEFAHFAAIDPAKLKEQMELEVREKIGQRQIREEKKKPVIELTSKTFHELITPDGPALFVNFMFPWCMHCKKLKGVWEDLGLDFLEDPDVRVASVDCVKYRDLCTAQNIEECPTLKVYFKGSTFVYSSPDRNLDSLKDFLQHEVFGVQLKTDRGAEKWRGWRGFNDAGFYS
eukprot:Tamp_14254.p1 GENE.Tamp_14254~~Tamp_14254.p1  ORF type:complete len:408 (-),score=69.77 Tamp_14254:420-1601(-)